MLVDALVRLAVRVALGIALAALVGGLWGLLIADELRHGLTLGFYVAGTVSLAIGLMGVSSPSRRDSMAASWQAKWASRAAFARNRDNRDDARLSDTVVFVLVALALFVVGVLSETL